MRVIQEKYIPIQVLFPYKIQKLQLKMQTLHVSIPEKEKNKNLKISLF